MNGNVEPEVKPCHRLIIALVVALAASRVSAVENTKVLPRGIRSLDLFSVSSLISEKTDASGQPQPLGQPLAKELTFAKITQDETGLKQTQLKAFLLTNGFSENQSVGTYTADLQGSLNVMAAMASYGLSDRMTLAVAVPWYSARTSVSVGFRPNATGQTFLNSLADPANNQVQSAREAGGKINHAVGRLNDKLVANHYARLGDWSGQGLGDSTIAMKGKVYDVGRLTCAVTAGAVAPTGRTDDPDNLTDMGFGDGQWDVFAQLATDQSIGKGLTVNEYVKYTDQLAGRKTMRETTADETIEVADRSTRFKLGDKTELGTSLQYEHKSGFTAALGMSEFRKFGDRYDDLSAASRSEVEADTDQRSRNGELGLGYTGIPAFRRGQLAVPFDLKASYMRQFSSINMPVTHFARFDINVFF